MSPPRMKMPGGQNVALQDLSETQRWELAALAKEKDPEIYWQDLYGFGLRLEALHQIEAAITVYTAISEAPSGSLCGSALSRLHAIQGVGSLGPRFEFLLDRFVKEASDPAMILPMVAGTTVFTLVRAATLSRLIGGSAGLLTRGLGAQMAAVSMGYLAEVPSFVLSAEFVRHLVHGDSKPESRLRREFASAALTLGVLKFTGGGSQAIVDRGYQALGATRSFAALRMITSQGFLLGGLLAAQALEEKAGLRLQVDGATTITDALASMLTLGAGAHLGHRALGVRFAGFQREMGLRLSESLRLQVKNFVLAGACGVSSMGGGGIPSFGSRRSRNLSFEAVRSQLLDDLSTLRDETNPFAGRIDGLDRRMEARLEFGDSIRRKSRRGKIVYLWNGGFNGEIPEETGKSEYETYLAWRKAAGLREGPLLPRDSAEVLDLGRRLKRLNVELNVEFPLSTAQVSYVRAILDLLPGSFFKNHYVRRLSLGVPNAGESAIGDQFYYGDVRISKATLRGSRRMLAATILHELGHSVEMRYAADLSEIASIGILDPSLGAPFLPDLSIPREVRLAMHRHYELVRSKNALSFAMNVFDDPGKGLWEMVGFPRRQAYITGSFREFMAEYVLYYVGAGAELRRFMQGPAQPDLVRRAYQGIYEELRDRVFDGREYDEHGMLPRSK